MLCQNFRVKERVKGDSSSTGFFDAVKFFERLEMLLLKNTPSGR